MTDELPETDGRPAQQKPTGPDEATDGSGPTGHGPRLAAIVIFVSDLDQSAEFYSELLRMEITNRQSTALLLLGSGNTTVALRAIGPRGEHPLGAKGIQYASWIAHDPDDLARCERFLKDRSAHVSTNSFEGRTVVEGRDPDGLPVMVVYPAPDDTTLRQIMTRIYAW